MLGLAAIIGTAAVGAVTSAYSEYNKSKSASKAKEAAAENEAQTRQWATNLLKKTEGHYTEAKESGLYGTEEDVNNYLAKARGTDYEALYNEFYDLDGDGVADTSGFSFDGSVEDYYNPNAQRILGEVAKKTQGLAAGQGMGRSFDALSKVIGDVEAKDESLWNSAQQEYNTARSQAYNEWNSYLQQKNNQLHALFSATQNDLGTLQGIAQMYQGLNENEFSDLMNAEIAAQNATQAAAQTTAQTGNNTVDLGAILTGGVGFASGVKNLF